MNTREQALELHAMGLQVVPALSPRAHKNFKRPALPAWTQYQDALVPREQAEEWFGPGYAGNVGIVTGRCSGGVFIVDIDNEEGLRWWETLCKIHNNGLPVDCPVVTTPRGGRHLYFREPPTWKAPTIKGHGVDIRGRGGFVMCPPSVGDRGEYLWQVEIEEVGIPLMPKWGCDAIDAMSKSHQQVPAAVIQSAAAGTVSHASGHAANGAGGVVYSAELHKLGKIIDGREGHLLKMLAAAHADYVRENGCTPTAQDLAEIVWPVVQAKYDLTRPGEDGQPYDYARVMRGAAKLERRVEKGAAIGLAAGEILQARPDHSSAATGDLPALDVQPLGARGYHEIAPMRWVVPGLTLKQNITMLVAPPGVGKSMMSIHLAISTCTGVPWGGYTPRETGPVLIVNMEDDADIMDRRCRAAADAMGVDREQYRGKLLFLRGASDMVVSRSAPGGAGAIRTPMYEAMRRKCRELGLVSLYVDPFAETFTGDENSNSEVKFVISSWRELARDVDAAVMLIHHTKKFSGGMAGDADASRGASALIGAARIMKTLFTMSAEEAKALEIDPEDRKKYLRLDDAKGNHSAIEKARWFERCPVTVPTSDPAISESVPFLKPWAPPGAFGDLSNEALNDCLDVIARGEPGEDGRLTGELYSRNPQAGSRWVGSAIKQTLGVDEGRAKRIIKSWLESGLLVEEEFTGAGHRKRKGLRVVDAARPGVTSE